MSNNDDLKRKQEELKVEQEKLVVQKIILELKILQTRIQKIPCLIITLISLLGLSFLAIIGIGIVFFISTWNWIQLIFGALLTISFVVLNIILCRLLKSLLSDSDEE